MADQINFDFKLVTPDNFERFSEMANICLGLQADSAYFRWKYLDNPAGQVIAYEAQHKGEVAGFYGVIPEFYLINGEKVKIYQSMDTMTHPKYQKRGLFTKLANLTYDHIADREGGINLVGIPGSNSLHGFVAKLAWKDIHYFNYIFAQRGWFATRSLLQKRDGLTLASVIEGGPALERYFKERESSPKPISNLMSSDFFCWRVLQNPHKGFKVIEARDDKTVVGLCVYTFEPEEKRSLVHLLDFSRQSYFKKYTATVLAHLFAETGSQFVYTWQPLNQTIYSAYKSCGFIRNPLRRGPFSYRIPFIVREQGKSASSADWFDANNFDLQPLMQD